MYSYIKLDVRLFYDFGLRHTDTYTNTNTSSASFDELFIDFSMVSAVKKPLLVHLFYTNIIPPNHPFQRRRIIKTEHTDAYLYFCLLVLQIFDLCLYLDCTHSIIAPKSYQKKKKKYSAVCVCLFDVCFSSVPRERSEYTRARKDSHDIASQEHKCSSFRSNGRVVCVLMRRR